MGLALNLGSGDRYVAGWTNVDWESPYPKDLNVDLRAPLPWAAGEVERVYCGHVLEHLTRQEAVTLLDRLRPCMQSGGRVLVVGPDVDIAQAMIDEGTFDFRYHQLDSLRFGGHRWPGDEHQWECTTRQVVAMLEATDWAEVVDVGIANVGPDWPVADRVQRWQCAVTAVAP